MAIFRCVPTPHPLRSFSFSPLQKAASCSAEELLLKPSTSSRDPSSCPYLAPSMFLRAMNACAEHYNHSSTSPCHATCDIPQETILFPALSSSPPLLFLSPFPRILRQPFLLLPIPPSA